MAALLAVAGLGLASWGTWAAASPRRPLDLVGSLAAPVGVALLAIGLLGGVLPGFLE